MKRIRGISLIEMLVSTIVLMILAIGLFFGVGDKIAKARDAKRKADMDRIKLALYDYIFDNNCFPDQLPGCGQSLRTDNNVYLLSMPCDDQGNSYIYIHQENDCPIWFRLFTNLEVDRDNSIIESGCGEGCGPECVYNYGVSSTNTKANIGCVKYYVCPPGGGGKTGEDSKCQAFEDPDKSNCPKVWENDPTCGGIDCTSKEAKDLRCANASGKTVPKDVDFY